MKTPVMLAGILLLFTFLSYGLDPPVKVWEKWYYTNWDAAYFEDIELAINGDLFITALIYDITQPTHESFVALLLDQNGNCLWEVPHPFEGAFGYDGAVLPDGSYVITGTAVEDSTSNSVALFIQKISTEGTTIWAKIYDFPDTREEGYGITCLPDGGFAVCGRVHGTGIQAGQAWLLRTDATGDTLWTETWGTANTNFGKGVVYNNGEICVLALGKDDTLTTYGTHLLFFGPDGEYLRGTTESLTTEPASICTTVDGGYTFTNTIFPRVWHTDQYGNLLWWKDIYVTPNDRHKGYCIRQTMDSGYIFSGWDGYYEYEPGGNLVDYEEGWLARFDSEGNELWNINNTISVNHAFYSCLQLPQGGYMACGAYNVFETPSNGEPRGSSGYLVRYAPETGIEEPEPATALRMDVSPNPLSSSLSIYFSLPEAMEATLTVFDLNGRVVGEVADGTYWQGISTIEWIPPANLGSGCYLVRLSAAGASVTRNCVLIR